MSNINKLGNGIGYLYIQDLDGNLVVPGVPNNSSGVRSIRQHALVSSPIGYTISAKGSIDFETIGSNQNITSIQIDSVEQFDTGSPIAVVAGASTQAAIDVAVAINSYIPISGVNYKAVAVGRKVFLLAPESAGASVNGDVVLLTIGVPADHTITIENIDGGSNGEELISEVTGFNYYLNATPDAVIGDIAVPGTEDISRYIIGRGTNQQIPTVTQQIANTSVTDLERYSQIQVLKLTAAGATNLDSINGDFAMHDILIVRNMSAFTITMNDLSINSGNIKLNPTTFAMTNDNYIMWLMRINDPTDGVVWQEICRVPRGIDADSITDTELAALSVGTSELKDTAVTTAKIALLAITNALMAANSVGTNEIIDLNVTTDKINDLAVTVAKIANLAVTTAKINDLAVTTDKIADEAVTIAKTETTLKTELITVPVVFETGHIGQVKVELPYNCTVQKISAAVTKLIEATDDAVIIPKNNAGTAMTDGQIDLTASAPIGNSFTSSPSGNNTFTTGQSLTLEISKTTSGGEALVSVHVLRT